jgi:hypothetical protein
VPGRTVEATGQGAHVVDQLGRFVDLEVDAQKAE